MSFDDEQTGTADLTKWAEQFSDIEAFPERTGGGGGAFDWQLGVAYAVRIKNAKVARSKFGDLQIEMNLDVLENEGDEDGPSLGTTRQWLDLPKQPSDIGKDRELVIKLTHKRYSNLLRVLAAAAPAQYALYSELTTHNGKKAYKDFDGKVMSPDDFDARKVATQTACVEFAESLRNKEGEEIEELNDTLLFIEKVENKKNAKYPYTNYFSFKPEKVPMFKSAGSDAPF